MATYSAMGPAAMPGGQNEGPPFKLYIAGVPKDFTAEQLQPSFDPYGEVVSAVILIEKGGTGLSRGCAFVCYATEAQAQAAVTGLDNQMTLPGGDYNMRVRFAQRPRDMSAPPIAPPTSNVLTEVDRRRLFFTRGPPGIQAITVNGAFSPYGEIEEINLFPERDQNTTKGCGFVQYIRHEDAAKAMSHLQGSLQLEGVAQKLTVTWADPERRMLKRKFQDGGIAPNPNYHKPMPSVPPGEEREVFFAKIPRAATEEQLTELFTRNGGPIERVKIFTAAGAPHHKCCGLATFMTHQGASNAILALDGIYLWPKFTDPMVVKWMDHSMSKPKRMAPGSAPPQGMNGNRAPRPMSGPYVGGHQQQYQQVPQQQMMYGQEQQQPQYGQQQMYGQDQYGYGQQMQPVDQQWQYQQQAPQPVYANSQPIQTPPQQQQYSQAAPQQQAPQYAQQAAPPTMYSANGQQQRQYAPARQADESYGSLYSAGAQKVATAYTPHPVASQSSYAQDPQVAPAQQQQYAPAQGYQTAQQPQYQDAQQPMQQYYTPAPQQQDQVAQLAMSSYGQAAQGGAPASGGYGASAVGGSQLFPIQLQQRPGAAGRG